MNFWDAQRQARKRTTLYLVMFVLMTLGVAIAGEYALRNFVGEDYEGSFPLFGVAFLLLTFGVAAYNYLMYKSVGGSYVAESVGGRLVDSHTANLKERQLLNVVEEIALATSLPIPKTYIIPAAEINAFAAGITPDTAAIAVTEGTLYKLNRDELQGVIAHEFGHIANADMVISLRLAAMVMGFYVIAFLGLRLLQGARVRSNGNGRGGNPIFLLAFALLLSGAITWFFGSILKATVSRQREYLADASSVQYTRNPAGIANALRKIGRDALQDMPKEGSAYSHMYFEGHASLFSTHPPISKRIEAIEGKKYIPEAWENI